MNNKHQAQSAIELKLLEALYSIRKKPKFETCGICDNVNYLLAELDELDEVYEGEVPRILLDLFETWPKFSGNRAYPIKAPGFENGEESYKADANKNKWGGEYGNLRKELLEFLINSLENKS